MISALSEILTQAKTNPIIAGAISIWGMGAITLLCYKAPKYLIELFIRHCTTSVSFSDSEGGYSSINYSAFIEWVEKNDFSKWSRSMALVSNYRWNMDGKQKTAMVYGIGSGRHYFIRGKRLFYVTIGRNLQAANIINTATVTMVGRSKTALAEVVDEFRYEFSPNNSGIFKFDDNAWVRESNLLPRTMGTVIVSADIKTKINTLIGEFSGNREWYYDRGLAHKMTFILHGIPGTGKTSFIKALAHHHHRNLYVLNINNLSDEKFESAMAKTPENSIVVIEDFDSASATKNRSDQMESAADSILSSIRLSLTGMLNVMDGVTTLSDKIIILTTNHLDRLDPALIRKGRVDYIFELGKLTDIEVKEYITLMFPCEKLGTDQFDDIVGCDLQSLYFDNKDNFSGFVDSIPKVLDTTY